jgi:hypothetical protein
MFIYSGKEEMSWKEGRIYEIFHLSSREREMSLFSYLQSILLELVKLWALTEVSQASESGKCVTSKRRSLHDFETNFANDSANLIIEIPRSLNIVSMFSTISESPRLIPIGP